jgi:hypothetical protein
MTVQDVKARRMAPFDTPTHLTSKATRDISGALTTLLADMFALSSRTLLVYIPAIPSPRPGRRAVVFGRKINGRRRSPVQQQRDDAVVVVRKDPIVKALRLSRPRTPGLLRQRCQTNIG